MTVQCYMISNQEPLELWTGVGKRKDLELYAFLQMMFAFVNRCCLIALSSHNHSYQQNKCASIKETDWNFKWKLQGYYDTMIYQFFSHELQAVMCFRIQHCSIFKAFSNTDSFHYSTTKKIRFLYLYYHFSYVNLFLDGYNVGSKIKCNN